MQGIRHYLHLASQECIRQGLLVEGIQYLFMAGDDPEVAGLIAGHAHELFAINELPLPMQWSARLPDEIIQNNPGLCISFGWAAHTSGRPEKSQRFLE